MSWLQFIHPWLNKSAYIPNYQVNHLKNTYDKHSRSDIRLHLEIVIHNDYYYRIDYKNYFVHREMKL